MKRNATTSPTKVNTNCLVFVHQNGDGYGHEPCTEFIGTFASPELAAAWRDGFNHAAQHPNINPDRSPQAIVGVPANSEE